MFHKRIFKKKQVKDQNDETLRRTESTSSYMQTRRKIFVNMKVPEEDLEEANYVSNRVRTAKYTPISFIPKNLFEQFRNVANLYFLFLVILQCIPLFGVTEPAVSALPLIAILIITAIKDAFEDWKRNQSDDHVNNSKVLKLANWKNVNIPEISKGTWYYLYVVLGYLSLLSGSENKYAHQYRQIKINRNAKKMTLEEEEDKLPLTSSSIEQPPKTLMRSVRQRSDTIRSELSNMFRPNHSNQNLIQKKQCYRPGSIPHSVLYRVDSERAPATAKPNVTPSNTTTLNTQTKWEHVKWKELNVGDYVKIENDQDIPADIVILSTSETDNICYVETQNLDGETNLKQRQGLPGTANIESEQDCEQAQFYIESEPPHVNIYQYSAVLRWQVDTNDTETIRSGVSHEKADAVTYSNILLRGCVLRNTKWVIGVVVYTGSETKIMLNTGRTPSKRSKMAKATNPHVSKM
jgi:phospholipid-translocating ATPase